MANNASARKRARQALVRHDRNVHLVSRVKTSIKKVLKAVAAQDKDLAKTLFVTVESQLDKLSNRGLYHKNKVARYKSRISKKIKAIAS